ncbi:hypothetical protein FHG87_023976 [Trinorchestia longiramus]|nr:hypothetical protein FHG87_023976 [Trinorchestia longiramus]
MYTNSLQQHVNEPTRKNNIPDLFMTTPDFRIIRLKVTYNIGDHPMIDFALQVHHLNQKSTNFTPYSQLRKASSARAAREKNKENCENNLLRPGNISKALTMLL